jgi:hypothetical protein
VADAFKERREELQTPLADPKRFLLGPDSADPTWQEIEVQLLHCTEQRPLLVRLAVLPFRRVSFAQGTTDFASGRNTEHIDEMELCEMIKQTQPVSVKEAALPILSWHSSD